VTVDDPAPVPPAVRGKEIGIQEVQGIPSRIYSDLRLAVAE